MFCLFLLFDLFFSSPFHIAFKFFFCHFIRTPNKTLLLVFYFLFFLVILYISYHTIVIPNPTQHPSLVLILFAIFLGFITVVVNSIFSHTTPIFYPLFSLFLLHLTSHKRNSFLSQFTLFSPCYKSLISFPLLVNSGKVGKIPQSLHYFSNGTLICSLFVCTLNHIENSPPVLLQFTLALTLIC